MAQRYIYIQDELNNKLKEETNASALITKLLLQHYQFNCKNLDEINKKITGAKEVIAQITEREENEIDKLERLKKQIEIQETERLELENKYKTKEGKFRDQFFKNYKDISDQEATEEMFNQFKTEWDKHEKGFNIFKFVDEHAKQELH